GVREFSSRGLAGAELAAGPLDIRPVRFGTARDLPRVPHAPPVLLEARPVRGVRLGLRVARPVRVAVDQIQRELERLARMAGELDELQKRAALRVLAQDGPSPLR